MTVAAAPAKLRAFLVRVLGNWADDCRVRGGGFACSGGFAGLLRNIAARSTEDYRVTEPYRRYPAGILRDAQIGSGPYFVMVTVLDLVPAWPCPGWPGAVPGRRVPAQAAWSGGLRGTAREHCCRPGRAWQDSAAWLPPLPGDGSNVVPALR